MKLKSCLPLLQCPFYRILSKTEILNPLFSPHRISKSIFIAYGWFSRTRSHISIWFLYSYSSNNVNPNISRNSTFQSYYFTLNNFYTLASNIIYDCKFCLKIFLYTKKVLSLRYEIHCHKIYFISPYIYFCHINYFLNFVCVYYVRFYLLNNCLVGLIKYFKFPSFNCNTNHKANDLMK